MPYNSPISDRNPETNNKQLLTIIGLFLGVTLLIIASLFFLVNQVINFIPVSVEQKLGKAVFAQLDLPKEKRDLTTEKKLNQLLDKLEATIPNDSIAKRDYSLTYIKEDTVNALAIPGDRIIIYQGLLDKVNSENELSMVLGHEIGHFANRDHLRGIGNLLLVQILISFFLGQNDFIDTGAKIANTVVNAQYSQNQEVKADEFGLHILNDYYGHVAGATDFFRQLEAQTPRQIAFLSSHPVPKKRVKKLKKLIKSENYNLGKKTPLNMKSKE